MNKKQLEFIRRLIHDIRIELQGDREGTASISEKVSELWSEVTNALRNEVWKEYLRSQEEAS